MCGHALALRGEPAGERRAGATGQRRGAGHSGSGVRDRDAVGRLGINLRQHDRQCVSVNVFLWGPNYKSCLLLLCFLELTECHVGQHFFW